MRLGCIADESTGATGLSSMLVRAGLRAVQVFGREANVERGEADAVVFSLFLGRCRGALANPQGRSPSFAGVWSFYISPLECFSQLLFHLYR